jgi:hypothetical protein
MSKVSTSVAYVSASIYGIRGLIYQLLLLTDKWGKL